MKVTVITATYRVDDMLERQAACLEDQTLDDFEWVVVDDHHADRVPPETSFPLTFVPPREVKDVFAPASAWNTGFLYANGDLAYFLNDYMLPTPKVLERHWELFERYGPAVIISGQIVPPSTQEVHRMPQRHIEPRKGPIVLDYDTSETKDWDHIKRWYWAGRNDSAGMAKCFEVNGFNEQLDGQYGWQDVEFAARMVNAGCRYIIDLKEACIEYAHNRGKKTPMPGDGESLFNVMMNTKATWAHNAHNLAEERYAHHR